MKRDPIPRIRIVDIAGLAGVSAGTVDRVLHNRGEVSPKTREKVMDIIKELNYEPDILASALAAKKTFRIAALLPYGTDQIPFWKYPVAGIEEGLLEIMHFGVSLERYYFDFFDRDSFLRQSSEILNDDMQGVIMASVFTSEAEDFLERCNERNIPVVLINANICSGSCVAFVGQDSLQSGMVAARLMKYGFGSDGEILIINFIRDEGNQDHILKREEGFRKYYGELKTGTPVLRQLNIVETAGLDGREILRDAILSPGTRVKGIFVTNSRVFRVARFLEENNAGDIILIGYDLLDENKHFLKNSTIDFLISQKPREQGYKSIMTLYHHLVLKKNVERNQYLPIDIITKENLEHYSSE